jgi:hypothetical protein
MGLRSTKRLPHQRLAPGKRGRFGHPAFQVEWSPWPEAEVWEVSAAYLQHLLAVALNQILDEDRKPATSMDLGSGRHERLAALATHCHLTQRVLSDKLAGRVAINVRDLAAWTSVAGIDVLPATISDLLPPTNT